MTRRRAWCLLLLILVVATGLRISYLEARSLWFDEAFSWRLVTFPLPEMIARDIADVHPPFYYVLLKVWTTVFGRSVMALRSFSVAAGVLTVGLVYGFTHYAFRSRLAALNAALLTALVGLQVQIAWEARMYTLGTVFAVLTAWLLLRTLREEKPRWLWAGAYGIAVALFAYIHYFALFSIFAQGLFAAAYLLVATRGRIGEVLQWRLTWRLAAAAVIAAACFAPWVPYFLQQNSQVQEAFWIPRLDRWAIPDTAYRMFIPSLSLPRFHGGIAVAASLLPFMGVLLAVAWLGLTSLWHKPVARAAWLVIASAVVPVIMSSLVSFFGQSLYQDRYLVFAHVFIVIAVAVFIARLRPWWLRLVTISVVAVGMLVADAHYWQALAVRSKPGAHAATRAIMNHKFSGATIISSSPFVFFSVLHYVVEEFDSRTQVVLYNETGEVIHFAGGPILKPTDVVGPEIFTVLDQPSLWVVDTTGFGGTPLAPPSPWAAVETQSFPEVFGYQGDVIVTRYVRVEQ